MFGTGCESGERTILAMLSMQSFCLNEHYNSSSCMSNEALRMPVLLDTHEGSARCGLPLFQIICDPPQDLASAMITVATNNSPCVKRYSVLICLEILWVHP